ncbi:hypothetical protein [Kineococcus indalonis]|uniref:hypothetical protein n=1 Tax=Kineococcus indalonis TaxID=2696566 RepID=UPI0014134879|nr:hypothetical protein [Kineococcus indalonis]NAZ85207.1 hypothetical protein [Kineococcus indalonis]
MAARIIPLRPPRGAPLDPYRTPATYQVSAPRPRSWRRRVVGTLVTLVALAGLTALVVVLLDRSPASAPEPPPAVAPTPTAGLTWQRVQGVYFPVSATDGPTRIDGQLVAGFAETDLGAALAAVHIVYRASAAPGPAVFGPALREQVVGPGAADLAQAVAAEYAQARDSSGLPDGAPLGEGTATFLGYRVADLPGGNRDVQVVERAPDENGVAQIYAFDVVLTRVDGDWKVVAPASGTWNTAFSRLPAVPQDMVAFTPASPDGGA